MLYGTVDRLPQIVRHRDTRASDHSTSIGHKQKPANDAGHRNQRDRPNRVRSLTTLQLQRDFIDSHGNEVGRQNFEESRAEKPTESQKYPKPIWVEVRE